MTQELPTLDSLKDEYISQIRGIFPLYKVVIFVVALTVVVVDHDSVPAGISAWLMHQQIRSFTNFDSGYFSDTTLMDILLAISFLILGVLMHRLLRLLLLNWLTKVLKLSQIAKDMHAKSANLKSESVTAYFVLKKAENEASNWSKRISYLSQISESGMTLSLVFTYAGYFGNFIDFSIAILFLIGALVALRRSYIVFLKHYLPHMMHINGLLGRDADVQLPQG